MPTTKNTPSLLDHLALSLESCYLSALRNEALYPSLYHALLSCPAGDWPLRDWKDALHYLTDEHCAAESCEEVRTQLLKALGGQDKKRR